MFINSIPQGADTVQAARQKAPKEATANSRRVRSHGQFRARDTYWNRPMSKDEKRFLAERDRWGSRRHDKTLTPEERNFAGVQFGLWHEAVLKASAEADAEHTQKLAQEKAA